MSDIITEQSGSILRVQLNRPAKKNAMTSAMYVALADLLNAAAKDDQVRVVLLHGAGDSFSAGNDIADFLKNPPGPGESPQAQLINARTTSTSRLSPLWGACRRGRHHDADLFRPRVRWKSTKFQMPFINLASFPSLGVAT